MAQEKYFGKGLNIGDPSDEWVNITPSDTDPIPNGPPNYLYVGVAGTAVMVDKHMTVSTVELTQGYHLFRPTFIGQTGTTAGQIVGFYDGVPQ